MPPVTEFGVVVCYCCPVVVVVVKYNRQTHSLTLVHRLGGGENALVRCV